jgi:hypothetical protein
MTMDPKLILCLALVLSGGLSGCSSVASRNPYEAVTTAINNEDWIALHQLTKPGMRANEYAAMLENSAKAGHPLRVGKLISVEKNSKYYLDGKPCTTYSFAWETKDGTASVGELQVLVRSENGKSTILDFWNFGW